MPPYEQWGHTFSKTIDLKIKLQVEKSQKHNQSLPKRSNSRKKDTMPHGYRKGIFLLSYQKEILTISKISFAE